MCSLLDSPFVCTFPLYNPTVLGESVAYWQYKLLVHNFHTDFVSLAVSNHCSERNKDPEVAKAWECRQPTWNSSHKRLVLFGIIVCLQVTVLFCVFLYCTSMVWCYTSVQWSSIMCFLLFTLFMDLENLLLMILYGYSHQ